MKLIFSRKAFDSAAGGCASPIMPDGRLVPLPIPYRGAAIHYEDITIGGHNLGRLVSDLTRGGHQPHSGAHLDPDLDPGAYRRADGWRPLFGQADAAQVVLDRHGIGAGDVFLFFGWFRRVADRGGAFRFVSGAPDLHVLWGWLQVDAVLKRPAAQAPAWAAYHSHCAPGVSWAHNTVYVATESLQIGLDRMPVRGGGVFQQYNRGLQLTKPGATRSVWSLPRWFAPSAGRRALGYHDDPDRWSLGPDRVELQAVSRGQEFVLDTAAYPESMQWLRELFSVSNTSSTSGG